MDDLHEIIKNSYKSLNDFKKLRKCIFYTANKLSIGNYDVINELSLYNKNFRKEYRQLLKKYRKKLPHSVPEGEENRKLAETILDRMDSRITGIRDGEVLIGIRNTTQDAVMIYRNKLGNVIRPLKKELNELRHFPDLYETFLNKLGAIDFFGKLSVEEREDWLEEFEDSGNVDISDYEGAEVEILQLGKSNLLNLPDEDITSLLSNGTMNAYDVRELFPGKPGSGGRNTLFFYSEYWKISVLYKIYRDIDQISKKIVIIDTNKGVLFKRRTLKKNESVYIYEGIPEEYILEKKKYKPSKLQDLGFLVEDSTFIINRINVINIAKDVLNDIDGGMIYNFNKSCKNFTAASLKSLMQKIVRFTPLSIELGKYKYNSKEIIVLTLAELLLNPGSFVPDIQRFVSGIESMIKRLAVTLFEDSCIDNESSSLFLMSNAYLAQNSKSWKPTEKAIRRYFNLGIDAVSNNKYYKYDIPKGLKMYPYAISKKSSIYQLSSSLFDELKSFASDLAMVRYIASVEDISKIIHSSNNERPSIMPFCHCVDQHWAPEMLYLYPSIVVKPYIKEGSMPFSEFLNKLFTQVTGINPRKEKKFDLEKFERNEFVKETRNVQKLYLKLRQSKPFKHILTSNIKTYKFTLDNDWIAGMLGAIEIPMRPKTLVSLKPGSIYDFIAIKKPTRGMKDATLKENELLLAINKATSLLSTDKGLLLNKSVPPLPELKGSRLILQDGIYYINIKGKIMEWRKYRHLKIETGIIKEINHPLYRTCVSNDANIITQGYKYKIKKLINTYSISEIRRALTYIGGFNNSFEFNRVSRDGGGTKHSVIFEDIGAYQFILNLAILVPAALRRVEYKSLKFESLIGPLLWKIRDYISELISTTTIYKSLKYGKIRDKQTRSMWEHQNSSLHEMIDRNKSGKKGHFLWLTVGLGKTMIVMEYLKLLIKENRCPPHIIYTLPSSAITSVISEIESYGFTIRLHIPLSLASVKKHSLYKERNDIIRQGCNLEKYTLSIIEHDHLRRCEETLNTYASSSIFIIDEVHKALNDTKRTSVALGLSRLSHDFIALTGTPIIDTNTYKLIWWLSQISQFSVNEKNFWVAANGMISRKINTGIKVKRKEHVAQFIDNDEQKYIKLVPTGLGGTNTNATANDLHKAVDICYKATRIDMVNVAKSYLKKKVGVMMVAKDSKDVIKLKELMLKNINELKDSDIFILEGNQSIYFTDSSVNSGKTPDYKIVIVPIKKSEGYTMTRLHVMISGVYPSNNATREQIEGRINRIGQSSEFIIFHTIHCGILTHILKKHYDAKNLSSVLQTLAENVNINFK